MWFGSFHTIVLAVACLGVSLPLASGESDVGVGDGDGGNAFVDFHRSLDGGADADQNSRKCGEVIDVIPAGDPFNPATFSVEANTLNYGVNSLVQGLGAFLSNPNNTVPVVYEDYYGIFLDAVGRSSADASQFYTANYGVKVVKVCGRCGDYKLPKDKVLRAAYKEYCGQRVYGRDATFSGVALIPIDSDGNPLEGAMKGAISSPSIQTDGFQTSSVQWPSSEHGGVGSMLRTDAGFYINFVPAMMAAGTGEFVGLIVDNIGFGESSDYFKTPFVKKGYQTSVLPLWLATQDLVTDMSDCATELVDKVVINGQSEGGFGTLAIAEALDDVGVEIILAQPGTPADIDLASSKFVDDIIKSTLSPRFSYAFAMLGSTFSSSRPDLPNYGIPEQGFLSDDSSAKLVRWANGNLEIPELREKVNKFLGMYSPPLNTEGINPMVIASVNNTGLVCNDPVDYNLEKLCEAVAENQVIPSLRDIRYPVEICHSPGDELVPYNGEAYASAASSNAHVSIKPALTAWQQMISFSPLKNYYTHAPATPACITMQGWTTVDDTTAAEMSGKCRRNRKTSKKKKRGKRNKRKGKSKKNRMGKRNKRMSKLKKKKKGETGKDSMKSGSGGM